MEIGTAWDFCDLIIGICAGLAISPISELRVSVIINKHRRQNGVCSCINVSIYFMQSYVSLDKTVSCVVSWIFMFGCVLISVKSISVVILWHVRLLLYVCNCTLHLSVIN